MAIRRPGRRGSEKSVDPTASSSSTGTGTSTGTRTGTGTAVVERDPAPARTGRETRRGSEGRDLRSRVRDGWPLLLLRTAHPLQAVLTAGALATAAAFAGRPGREVLVVALTVLTGQAILGWHNDLVDRVRDERHQTPGKPLADGRLDPGTAWFALACAVLLVVPLSVSTGITAGSCYLLSLAIGMLGNVALRTGPLSWLTWAVAFSLYPAYLAYGGWGGQAEGGAPQLAMTLLAAALGVGVHVLRSTFGLVSDHEDGWTYLPLTLGLKLGATRLLALASAYVVVVGLAVIVVGGTLGLRQ